MDLANSSEKTKRKRSKNFTELEVRFLIDLVIKYIKTVENKKTDAVSWNEKEKVWKQIALEFQALSGMERSFTVLRAKYDAFKHILKSKVTKNKSEIFKTGGGTADIEELTDNEKKIMNYITLNVEGLPSNFDSDSGTRKDILNLNDTTLEKNTDQAASTTDNGVKFESQQNGIILAECIAQSNITHVIACESLAETLQQLPESSEEKENTQSQKWKTWNPKALKTRKHKALSTPTKRKIDTNSLNEKLDDMVSCRGELLHLQNEVTRKEIKYKEEDIETERVYLKQERGLKLQLLQLKIENQKLKQQFLKQQLKAFI